jgi:hypothetical protein
MSLTAIKKFLDNLRRMGPMPALLHLAAITATAFVIILLVARGAIYLQNAFDAVRYPFGLDYGEGMVWQQALLIPGPRMYGAITNMPFIVFHYPPVYHVAVRFAMFLGLDPLMAGRGLSVACTLAAAGLCAWLVGCGISKKVNGLARIVGCTIGGLLPLSLGPVEFWSVLMRVDMLAIFLSFLGVTIVVESVRRPAWLAFAIPVFVLALYTKQTALAAPIAALAVSLALNPRQTITASAFGAGLGLIGFGWLEWLTSGGFGRHIIAYNINTFSAENLLKQVKALWFFMFVFVLAAGALALLWRDQLLPLKRAAASRRTREWVVVAIATLWLIIATATLVTAGKTGASLNYFAEFLYVCALPIGILTSHYCYNIIINGPRSVKANFVLLFLMVVLIVPVAKYQPFRHPQLDDPKATEIQQYLIKEIAHSRRPVLSDDMVLIMRAGRQLQIEPGIFRELTATGVWNQTDFLQLINNHNFAFAIVLEKDNYTAEMLAAIAQSYPKTEKLGPYTAWREAESPSTDQAHP